MKGITNEVEKTLRMLFPKIRRIPNFSAAANHADASWECPPQFIKLPSTPLNTSFFLPSRYGYPKCFRPASTGLLKHCRKNGTNQKVTINIFT